MLQLIFSIIFAFLLAVISGGLADDMSGTGIGDFAFVVSALSLIVTVILLILYMLEDKRKEEAMRIEQARKIEEERKRKQRR